MSEDDNELIDTTSENIELNGDFLICYMGKEAKRIKSAEFSLKIMSDKIKNIKYDSSGKAEYKYDGNKIIIFYPLFEKKIKIIDSKGKLYKSSIYFTEDIKNIISYLKMKNPHFYNKSTGKYNELKSTNYSIFLLGNNELIKDIVYSEIKYEDLKMIYGKKEKNMKKKKKFIYLKEINDNIDLYSKAVGLKNEKIIFTRERHLFKETIQSYYSEKKNKMFWIYGSYSSGKSISLIMYNHAFDFPTLYLNLKVIKNSFLTNGYTTILPNEVINIFI